MSSTITVSEKKLKAEEGKFKKILTTVKKVVSKELLWFLLVAIVSIPIALIVSYVIHTYGSDEIIEIFAIVAGDKPTFMVIYISCAIGIYISRIIANAVKTQLETSKKG